ncbi:hypothetical protein [Streptomyces anulatus]|uniref:hypothetical protein n=1 Tax=Streptomyces anulatus TaxID=1892 RepID=UPI003867A1E3|nr:hypothetical protein OHB50_30800 [Streptomyces anulatus]
MDVQEPGQQSPRLSMRRRWARLRHRLRTVTVVGQLVLVIVRVAYLIKSWLL